MGKYSNEEWYLEEKQKYVAQYGEIPPHWIVFPDTHPYSMMWRMGGGETFVMVFSTWFGDNFNEERSKVDFFLKYPPPPRWLEIVASYIWEDVPMEGFQESGYLERLKKVGFSGTEEYLSDLEDPRWLG